MFRRERVFWSVVILMVSMMVSVAGPECSGRTLPGMSWDGDGGFDADYSDIPRLRWIGPGSPDTYREYQEQWVSTPFTASLVYHSPAGAGSRGTQSKALVLVESSLYSAVQTNLDSLV